MRSARFLLALVVATAVLAVASASAAVSGPSAVKTVVIALRHRDTTALESTLYDVSNPKSQNYGRSVLVFFFVGNCTFPAPFVLLKFSLPHIVI